MSSRPALLPGPVAAPVPVPPQPVEQYGIDISYIDNIVRMQKITRVPKIQSYFKGVINLRGDCLLYTSYYIIGTIIFCLDTGNNCSNDIILFV